MILNAEPSTSHNADPIWAIYSEENMNLAWSNDLGWVSGPDFDTYTPEEIKSLSLPVGGSWRLVA